MISGKGGGRSYSFLKSGLNKKQIFALKFSKKSRPNEVQLVIPYRIILG